MSVAVAEMVEAELYQLEDGGVVFAVAWADGFDVPEPLPVDEWAEEYRMLPRESSSEPGKWRNSRNPNLVEPMRSLSDVSPYRRVILVFGTQSGKTEIGNNWIGSSIHQDPCSMMVVMPNEQMGMRWTRQRFNPMVRLTPALRERIAESRSRDGGNTATMKEFPGGFLVIAHSHSAAALSSMPVKKLFCDEVDRYPDDVGGEGHPLDIASARTSSYPRRKELVSASPTVKGESVVWDELENSNQHYRYVPCPHCGHMHILADENLLDDGVFVCPTKSGGCGAVIEEHHKTKMLELAEWRSHTPEYEGDSIGYQLPSYYTPTGLGLSWKEIADKRTRAKKNPEKWKTYINTIMAECYEDESGKLDWKEIADRAGGYSSRVIPDGCLMLVASVDTQDDRWESLVFGIGRNKWWVIDYRVIPGQPGDEKEWEKLDSVLDDSFVNAYGVTMKPLAMTIDTGGHHTHMAYWYCRRRKHRRVLAVKGSKFYGRPIMPSRPSPQDIDVRGRTIRAGVDLWHVGTDTAKGAIYAKLMADIDVDHQDMRFHFPSDLPDDFYQQLTAERFDSEKGRWVKPRHRRNEVLDLVVYALAAACHPAIRYDKLRDRDWDKIEQRIQPLVKDLFGPEPDVYVPQDQVTPQPDVDENETDDEVGEVTEQSKSKPTKPKPKPKRKRKRRSRWENF